MPTEPAENMVTEEYAVFCKEGKKLNAQVWLTVCAAPRHQRAVVAFVAKWLFGDRGKAKAGRVIASLPHFTLAAEGPRGLISGLDAMIEWVQYAMGDVTRSARLDDNAVRQLEAWQQQESDVTDARRRHGLTVEDLDIPSEGEFLDALLKDARDSMGSVRRTAGEDDELVDME